MHQYLRSIGFSRLVREQDIDKLLKGVEKHALDSAHRYIDSNEQMWLELRAPVSEQMGICITGYMGARGKFHRVAYYPYLWSDDVTSTVRPSVFRKVDGELFSAIIDDSRVGMTLIYQMDNPFDYLHKCGEGNSVTGKAASKLTAFCTKGFVLLPSVKADNSEIRRSPGNMQGNCKSGMPSGDSLKSGGSEASKGLDNNDLYGDVLKNGQNELLPFDLSESDTSGSGEDNDSNDLPSDTIKSDQEARMSLLEAARNGQAEAIEQLALEEMNTIATLSKRLQTEDIYSIVRSVFMPQGVECEIYLVVGDILRVKKITNEVSGEEIFDLTLNVNDMIIHVAINEADLEGEPTPGRRFKGRIWLQGRIEF